MPSSDTDRSDRWLPYLPRIATAWASDRADCRSVVVDGTLVFVDISGFTALSERLAQRGRVGAEELTGTLSACFAGLLDVAYLRGGSLLKFGGDALLLLFDGDEHEVRGAASAMEMRTAMRGVGRVETSVGAFRLRMSVGVHSGPVHLFRVGESHHELVVTGPAATATVEMESTADAGEIVVSAATAAALDPRWVGAAKGPGFLLRDRATTRPAEGLPPTKVAHTDLSMCIAVALRDELAAGSFESEHRYATVGFIHYDGVDELLATVGEDAVGEALDALVTRVQHAVDEHNVTFLATDVDRDGGKIIVVGGAPRAFGDDAGRVLRALRMVVDEHSDLPIRIGVNRGHVFVGEVGPFYRRTFTVMGDAVNLAARVMSRAEPGQILVTGDVLDHSHTRFRTRPLPPFAVKGKKEPVEAFVLGARAPTRATQEEDELPFVGRVGELATLTEVLARLAAARRGGTVEIVGPSGIGKSRLVQEARRATNGVKYSRVLCEPYEAKTPYFAFRHLLRALLPVRSSGAAGGDALTQAVTAAAPELLPWLPLLATVIDVDVRTTEEVAALEPRFRRERTRWAVGALLRAVVQQPVAFVIEDAQWLDELSADLIEYISQCPDGGCPWLFVIVRTEDGAPTEAECGTTRIVLEPLDQQSTRSLIALTTAETPIPPVQRDVLTAQSGGNPLFLRELLRARDDFGTAELPNSLEALIAAEIDRLPPADRRLLRLTSVLGTVFDEQLVSDIVDGEDVVPDDVALRLNAFIEDAGDNLLRFRNQCHREVAYETLPFGRRRALHERVGDAIERRAGDAVVERSATLSYHFLHAQRFDRCWEYAKLAAEHARAQYANTEAMELYERALRASTHVDAIDDDELAGTWEALGDVAITANSFERARTAYLRTAKLRSSSPHAQAMLCAKQAATALWQSKADRSLRWVRRGLRVLRDSPVPDLSARAEVQSMYAQICLRTGRNQRAVRWAEAAVEDAITSANRRALASAYKFLDWALIQLGRSHEAVHTALALGIWVELGELNQQAQTLTTLGVFAYWQGAWDEAVVYNRRAREASLRAGNLNDAAIVATNGAEILIAQGRLEEAETELVEARELFRSLRQPAYVAEVDKLLGVVALRRGDLAGASARLAEAKATADDASGVEIDGLLAECQLRMGELRAAAALVGDAITREAATGATTFTPMLRRIRACASATEGRAADAWKDLDVALAVARERGANYEIALTLDVIAALAARSGLPPDPGVEEERLLLLERLGVRWTPPPPLPDPDEMPAAFID
jgi:class 3 adenylate cyclase/tetratricopeptide (TPR) repeat protein